jgi:hypothetical protein
MIVSKNTIAVSDDGPRYYRSFASYKIPFEPDEPVEFADTAGLRSYYVAYHDAAGRVVRFEKVSLVRAEKEPREFALPAPEEPDATLYFRVVRDSASKEPCLGEQLDYRQTESLTEFFAGKVDAPGKTCRAGLFRRESAFTEAYDYWPNSRLRKRTRVGSVVHFDREGRPIAEPLPETADAT